MMRSWEEGLVSFSELGSIFIIGFSMSRVTGDILYLWGGLSAWGKAVILIGFVLGAVVICGQVLMVMKRIKERCSVKNG